MAANLAHEEEYGLQALLAVDDVQNARAAFIRPVEQDDRRNRVAAQDGVDEQVPVLPLPDGLALEDRIEIERLVLEQICQLLDRHPTHLRAGNCFGCHLGSPLVV